jgi:hypothetical protein
VAPQINSGAMATMTPSIFAGFLIFVAPSGDSSFLFELKVGHVNEFAEIKSADSGKCPFPRIEPDVSFDCGNDNTFEAFIHDRGPLASLVRPGTRFSMEF